MEKLPTNPSDYVAAKYGATVVKGQDVEPADFRVEDLEFISLKAAFGKEYGLRGEPMRELARSEGAFLGLVDAQVALLRQQFLPNIARPVIVSFPGTVLHLNSELNPRPRIACLYWDPRKPEWWLRLRAHDGTYDWCDPYELVARVRCVPTLRSGYDRPTEARALLKKIGVAAGTGTTQQALERLFDIQQSLISKVACELRKFPRVTGDRAVARMRKHKVDEALIAKFIELLVEK